MKPAPPFILAGYTFDVDRNPFLMAHRNDIRMVADPRFQYGRQTIEALSKAMTLFLDRRPEDIKELVRGHLHGVIMDGFRCGDVNRATKEHPRAFAPSWPSKHEGCTYLGMGVPVVGTPVDLYLCECGDMYPRAFTSCYGKTTTHCPATLEAKKSDVNNWLACLLAEEEYLL